MSFERTFEEFVERLIRQEGPARAYQIAVPYCREFARDCRNQAGAASEKATVLRRLADQMDPDLRPVHVVAETVRDFESWCRDNDRRPRDPKVRHVTRPDQLRGIRCQRVELCGRYWRIPDWPELATIIRAHEMLADAEALSFADTVASNLAAVRRALTAANSDEPSPWLTKQTADDVVHAVPFDDGIVHDFAPDCLCGPAPQVVPGGVIHVHASLAGREHQETP